MTLISDDDVELYTSGDCYVLAQALHELTGFEVWTYMCDEYVGHCFVRLPSGALLDISGVHTQDEIMRQWDPHAWQPETMRFRRHRDAYELVERFDWEPFEVDQYTYDIARILIRENCHGVDKLKASC